MRALPTLDMKTGHVLCDLYKEFIVEIVGVIIIFYKALIASKGCFGNRYLQISVNETWLVLRAVDREISADFPVNSI